MDYGGNRRPLPTEQQASPQTELVITTAWRPLYRAAILETNQKVLPQRASDAEAAVIARRREIHYAGGTLDEKEALEDALYALHAFKTVWQYGEAA